MPTYKDIKTLFRALSEDDKEKLFREIYDYSKDMKVFLEGALLGQSNGEAFLFEMEKETIGKVYRRGEPKTPNGKIVQFIIARAKKARVSKEIAMELEKLAYRGFIEFLNEYGGGPENFESLAANHLEEYLKLAGSEGEENRTRLFEEVKKYLQGKDNMCRDEIDDVFASEKTTCQKTKKHWYTAPKKRNRTSRKVAKIK